MLRIGEGGLVRREVLAFAIPGVLLLALLAGFSFWVARNVAQAESVRDAVVSAEQAARLAVEPHLRAGLADGEPQAVAELDEVVRARLLSYPTVTVRVWRPDGTILYSDKPQLIGRRFDLGDEEREVLATGGVEAEVSDLSKPENRFERSFGELIEVYLPVTGPDGQTYLLEIYQRQAFLAASTQRMLMALAPTILGALAVLALILLLLAWRMARRLDADRVKREDLLLHAVNSSEAERRRIAADLHDGVVQDVAGVSFGLSAMAQGMEDQASRERLQTAADRTRKAVGGLRTLLVEIYPANLREAGLASALQDLGNGLTARATIDVEPGLRLDDRCQQTFYRIAREATQNIAKHARAENVGITLTREDSLVTLQVRDDGCGFDLRPAEPGHVGLTLMEDLAAQAEGEMSIVSAPGAGTTVRYTMECR